MMSESAEEAKGLAEILREVFALSESNRSNRSKCTAADDQIDIRVHDDSGKVIEAHDHVSDFKKPPTQATGQ